MERDTDLELLQASARGHEPAFDVFVERHRTAVFHFLRTMTPQAADAEDVLQQTFLAAWRNAGRAQVEHGARPWLLTIARHALHRLHRRQHGRPATASVPDTSLEALGEAAGFAAVDAVPERFAAAAEERAVLAAALADLPDADREILHLRDIEQLSSATVAALLGLALPAMKSRLHRARLRLVAAVRQRLPEETRS